MRDHREKPKPSHHVDVIRKSITVQRSNRAGPAFILKVTDLTANEYEGIISRRGAETQKSSQRALQLIESLLAYSRVTLSTDDYSTMDLSKTVQDVLSDLEERIQQSDARLEIGELPVLRADPIQMHQLLLNLIGNALKFSQEGEPPQIKVLCRTLQKTKKNESYCELTIEDKGIGFQQKNGDKIFLLGHRLHDKNNYEGSGIGLSICKRIIERHKGTIAVKSTPGQGTKFIITLPMEGVQSIPDS